MGRNKKASLCGGILLSAALVSGTAAPPPPPPPTASPPPAVATYVANAKTFSAATGAYLTYGGVPCFPNATICNTFCASPAGYGNPSVKYTAATITSTVYQCIQSTSVCSSGDSFAVFNLPPYFTPATGAQTGMYVCPGSIPGDSAVPTLTTAIPATASIQGHALAATSGILCFNSMGNSTDGCTNYCSAAGGTCITNADVLTMCSFGYSGIGGNNYICSTDLKYPTLVNGAGFLCYNSSTNCNSAPNSGCSVAGTYGVCEQSVKLCGSGQAYPGDLPGAIITADLNTFTYICQNQLPDAAVAQPNGAGAYCYASEVDCMNSPANACGDPSVPACFQNSAVCGTGPNVDGPKFSWICPTDYSLNPTNNSTLAQPQQMGGGNVTTVIGGISVTSMVPNAAGVPCYSTFAACDSDTSNGCDGTFGIASSTTCVQEISDCVTGLAAQFPGFTYTCQLNIPLASYYSGSGLLCYSTAAYCNSASNNACGNGVSCVASTEWCCSGYADYYNYSYICPLDFPAGGAPNAAGMICWQNASAAAVYPGYVGTQAAISNATTVQMCNSSAAKTANYTYLTPAQYNYPGFSLTSTGIACFNNVTECNNSPFNGCGSTVNCTVNTGVCGSTNTYTCPSVPTSVTAATTTPPPPFPPPSPPPKMSPPPELSPPSPPNPPPPVTYAANSKSFGVFNPEVAALTTGGVPCFVNQSACNAFCAGPTWGGAQYTATTILSTVFQCIQSTADCSSGDSYAKYGMQPFFNFTTYSQSAMWVCPGSIPGNSAVPSLTTAVLSTAAISGHALASTGGILCFNGMGNSTLGCTNYCAAQGGVCVSNADTMTLCNYGYSSIGGNTYVCNADIKAAVQVQGSGYLCYNSSAGCNSQPHSGCGGVGESLCASSTVLCGSGKLFAFARYSFSN